MLYRCWHLVRYLCYSLVDHYQHNTPHLIDRSLRNYTSRFLTQHVCAPLQGTAMLVHSPVSFELQPMMINTKNPNPGKGPGQWDLYPVAAYGRHRGAKAPEHSLYRYVRALPVQVCVSTHPMQCENHPMQCESTFPNAPSCSC